MPAWAAGLVRWLLAGGIVTIIATVGIAVASYAGLSALFDQAVEYVIANMTSGVNELVLTIMYLFGIFDMLAVVLGAYQALVVIKSARVFITRSVLSNISPPAG